MHNKPCLVETNPTAPNTSMPTETTTITIEACYSSPGHNFFGHHGKKPSHYPAVLTATVECCAGQGLKGDRFFGFKDNYKGQITFLEREQINTMEDKLDIESIDPAKLRRNIITRGIDLNTLIGKTFTIAGVTFQGMEECRPCYWMDRAVGEGAEECMRGKGGLRARILSDGTLQPGTYELKTVDS